MKVTKLFASMLAFVAFAGCTHDPIDGGDVTKREHFKVIASHVDAEQATRMWLNAETRATINADNKSIWQSNDKIAFTPDGGTQCELTAKSVSSDGKTATFEGEGVTFPGKNKFYAAYPSTATVAGNGTITFTISSEQDGSASSAMMLAATGERNGDFIEMNFEPKAAILHVATTEAMDRIVIESCAGEKIAGTLTASGTFTGSGTSITVDPDGTAKDFYVALPAVTLSKGYKIHYYKTTGSEQMLYSYGYSNGTSFAAGYGYKVNFTRKWSPITVTLGARSSYSFYDEGKITEANACNAETIYFSNTTVSGVALNCASSVSGISSTLVSEYGFIINGTETKANYYSATKTFSIANKTGQSWGTQMKVSAYVKHNGVIVGQSAEKTIHITGLPYKADGSNSLHKINTSGTYPWTNESESPNIKWYDTSVKLEGKTFGGEEHEPKVATPEFSVPADGISARIISKVSRNSGGNEFFVYTYDTNKSAVSIYGEKAANHDIDVAANLTPSVNRIMYHSNYSQRVVNIHTVSEVSILYR